MGIRACICLMLLLAAAGRAVGWPAPLPKVHVPPHLKPTTMSCGDPKVRLGMLLPAENGRFYATREFTAANVWAVLIYGWPEIVACIAGLGAVLALLRIRKLVRRRGAAGTPHCRKCNYNLTGLSSDRCPECGTHLTAKNRVTARLVGLRVAICMTVAAVLLMIYPILRVWKPERQPAMAKWLDWPSETVAEWLRRTSGSGPILYPPTRYDRLCNRYSQIVEIDPAGNVCRRFEPMRGYTPRKLLRAADGSSILACCSDERSVLADEWRVWDTSSGRCRLRLSEARDSDFFNSYVEDGQIIYSDCGGRWDAKTGHMLAELSGTRGSPSSPALMAAKCSWRVAVHYSGECEILDNASGRVLAALPAAAPNLVRAHGVLSADGQRLCVIATPGEGSRRIALWSVPSGKLLRRIDLPDPSAFYPVVVSADVQHMAYVRWRKSQRESSVQLVVANLLSGSPVAVGDTNDTFPLRLLFSSDGRVLLAWPEDGPGPLLYDLSTLPPSSSSNP